jgi:hypothetical protein
VRELYQRYRRQLQRWADYRNLLLFLSFCALFLGVLYAQRSAQVAYQVYNTVESVVAPASLTMQSTAEVYSWLRSLLQVRVGGWGRAPRPGGATSSQRSWPGCLASCALPAAARRPAAAAA